MRKSLWVFGLVLVFVAATEAGAQELYFQFSEDTSNYSGEYFGSGVAGVGDVNRDGWPDLLIGAEGVGRAWVRSGRDGSTIYSYGGGARQELAKTVSRVGDINQDGHGDYLVGAQRAGVLYSGRNGNVLYSFSHYSLGENRLGWTVSGVGDLNGDGYLDVVIGAPTPDHVFEGGTGYARAFSGRDGSLLYEVRPPTRQTMYAFSLAGAGDVNADGYSDFMVGSPLEGRGWVRIYSGSTGALLRGMRGPKRRAQFGHAVAELADVNEDGWSELLVGAPNAGDQRQGEVFVYSGRDFTVLRSWTGEFPGDRFGEAVADGGDVNGDRFPDPLIGAPRYPEGLGTGSARLYSGRDDILLYEFNGNDPGDLFGASVESAGDVDQDGLADVIIGAPLAQNSTGEVSVFLGNDLFLNAKPRQVAAGDSLRLSVGPGKPQAPSILVIREINGQPFHQLVADVERFGNDRVRILAESVPASLAGSTLTLRAYTLGPQDVLVETSDETITVQ